MIKKIFKFVYYWLPPLVLMTAIFILSSRQSISVGEGYTINFIVFKTLHVIEYAVLYFLLFRALYAFSPVKLTLKQKLLIPILMAVIYGISDELHQSFVPTRQAHLRDVFIDTLGILLAFSYTKKNLHSLRLLL